MYGFIVLLHTLAATVWTGGHLFLALGWLPKVLKDKDTDSLLTFERRYEKIGMPALLIQVITGLYLAHQLQPDFFAWFNLASPLSRNISLKLFLLLLTITLALIANFRIIPRLHLGQNLKIMAGLIYTVTLLSVLFVITGLNFRFGFF